MNLKNKPEKNEDFFRNVFFRKKDDTCKVTWVSKLAFLQKDNELLCK